MVPGPICCIPCGCGVQLFIKTFQSVKVAVQVQSGPDAKHELVKHLLGRVDTWGVFKGR